ncbi:MAG: polysaccharide deacetylase family protein [Pseudomonadota bacterium]
MTVEPLSAAQVAFVAEFVRTAGYEPTDIDQVTAEQLFNLLSRAEEYETATLHNGHNWELAFASLARRADQFSPAIDQLLEKRHRQGELRRTESALWPDNKRFALCLTHDVDILHEDPMRFISRRVGPMLGAPARQQLMAAGKAIKLLSRGVSGQSRPTPPLDAWLALEDRFGFRSTLHFMANEIGTQWDDGYYHLSDKIDFDGQRVSIRDAMIQIDRGNWDVGMHPGSATFRNTDLLKRQKALLESNTALQIRSTRQHHLYFDIRKTPLVLEAAGLMTDSTVGSNMDIGYRAGTGLPFFLYDLQSDRRINVLEIPLIIQDVTLARTLADDEELMVSKAIEFLEHTEAVGGAITLLWHNHFRPGSLQFRVYARILEAAAALGAWGCSMRQLDNYWRERCGKLDTTCGS